MMVITNPKKRKKRGKTSMAKKRTKKRSTKRKALSSVTRSRVTKTYRRNPRRRKGVSGIINRNVIPSIAGGAGALAVDIGMKYLPLPDVLKSGPMNIAARAGVALGLGFLMANFTKKDTAQNFTNGALTVLTYDALKQAADRMLPNIGLSAYMDDDNMGAYMEDLSAYNSPAMQSEYLDLDESGEMSGILSDQGYGSNVISM